MRFCHILVTLLVATCVPAFTSGQHRTAGSWHSNNSSAPTFKHDEDVRAVWASQLPYLTAKASTGAPEDLYEVQEDVYGMLEAAAAVGDLGLLEDVATIVLASLPYRKLVSNYTFDLGGSYISFDLDPPVLLWVALDKKTNTLMEDVLSSSQWIGLFARAARLIAAVPNESRGANMTALLAATSHVVVLDHVWRWALPEGGNTQGIFAVHAWGCGWPLYPSQMQFTHSNFNAVRLNRSFQVSEPDLNVSYCNAVTDTDLWIISAAANVLLASELDPVAVSFDNETARELRDYMNAGVALVDSRIRADPVQGSTFLFDPGSWDSTQDYYYANDTGLRFPSGQHAPPPHGTATWDISHFQRWVCVGITLAEARMHGVINSRFSANSQLITPVPYVTALATQVATAFWNGDQRLPLFNNFQSGANGWYRVNYSSRPWFGYGPSDVSDGGVSGGYLLLGIVGGPAVRDILEPLQTALENLAYTSDLDVIAHRHEHFWAHWDVNENGTGPCRT